MIVLRARFQVSRCGRVPVPLVLSGLALLLARVAWAAEVSVPLTMDARFIRQLLIDQVYYDPGETARVWEDDVGCNEFVLFDPQVNMEEGQVRIVSTGKALIGIAVAGRCMRLKSWEGTIEVFERPRLDPRMPVVAFEVVNSNVYGAGGQKEATGTVWDWVKGYVHPRLEALRVDLHGPLVDLKSALPLFLAGRDLAAVQRLVDSVSLRDAAVTARGLVVNLRMEVEEAALPAGPAPVPEPTLTDEELARWEKAWQEWDAFLTFVIKHAGKETETQDLRRELGSVLLDARHEFLDALRKSRHGAPDRVRVFFLHAWTRLAPVLRDLSAGLPGESALRFLSFVTAADALAALDAVGPQVGVEISTDGLRRLARIVAPSTIEDPVAYKLEVDPELRELLGFGPPLPLPEPEPDVSIPALFWFVPSPAWAAPAPRLGRWVPSRDEVKDYVLQMRELLKEKGASSPQVGRVEEPFRDVYKTLVLATAWQESCWRQFVEKDGRIETLRSAVGSVGIMQVNEKVWRGLYDLNALRNDVGYNAVAGSEVLIHYLVDYAIAKGEHTATGNVDNLARATYSAYNAGPGQLRRYRTVAKNSRAGRVDEAFWSKYQAVKAGRELEIARCFGVDPPAQ